MPPEVHENKVHEIMTETGERRSRVLDVETGGNERAGQEAGLLHGQI